MRLGPRSTSAPDSALYRRVWRWHFYAGLVCLPFLALLALTGAVYLFKAEIESLVYARMNVVEPAAASTLDAESLVARATAQHPGTAIRFVGAQPGRSAEVGISTPEGALSVYVDPGSGAILGTLDDDSKLMEIVKRIHSLEIIGVAANHWVEVVAGWAIVLVLSGVFLWWPRGRGRGVDSVRGKPTQRTWWRDVHAVVGITAAVAILFLAVTGMPWSAYWGKQFGRITTEWGIGLPKYLFGPAPASSAPLASLGEAPWTLAQTPVPQSAPHAGHAPAEASPGHADGAATAIALNDALRIFASLGLPAETPVNLPRGPRGVYTATFFPDDVRAQRVVHLDRYSGAILADVGYSQYGIAGRAVEWGIQLHTGRQFGRVNQLVMLAACLAILALVTSAAVMWWKRRPAGRLAAPPRREGDRAAFSVIAVAALLGLLYPLLGASMIVALIVDTAVPQRWHQRFGL